MVLLTELQLKSGRTIKIKLPPLSENFMKQAQDLVIETAVVNPEEYELTREEKRELYVLISQVNMQYWVEKAERTIRESMLALRE